MNGRAGVELFCEPMVAVDASKAGTADYDMEVAKARMGTQTSKREKGGLAPGNTYINCRTGAWAEATIGTERILHSGSADGTEVGTWMIRRPEARYMDRRV